MTIPGALSFDGAWLLYKKPLQLQALDQDRAQFILTYNTKDWEDWKRYVRPEDCRMPHRQVLSFFFIVLSNYKARQLSLTTYLPQ